MFSYEIALPILALGLGGLGVWYLQGMASQAEAALKRIPVERDDIRR